MNTELLLFVLVGGLPVVLSYIWYGWWSNTQFTFEYLQGPFKGTSLMLWQLSTLLVVISYVYMLVEFVDNPLTDTQKNILYPSYILFLSTASQYTIYSTVDLFNARKSYMLLFNLLLTALGSIGFFIVASIEAAKSNEPFTLLMAGTLWIFIHHFCLDAVVWYRFWKPEYSLP